MKRSLLSLALAALASLGQTYVHAELIATPLPGDTRLVQFPFDEDNTYLVYTKPKAVTHLQFAADETIQSVAAGDPVQWELSPTKNRRNIFVKPRYEALETSMSVITDKRVYQFVLKSTSEGKKWYQRVNWQYATAMLLENDPLPEVVVSEAPQQRPKEAREIAGSGQDVANSFRPEELRFGYEITGDAPFKPTNIFDNGKFTYFKMPSDIQELPALFAVVEGQEYSLVNYVIDGDYIIAQRLLAEAVLKLGKKEIRVIKKKPRTFLGFNVSE